MDVSVTATLYAAYAAVPAARLRSDSVSEAGLARNAQFSALAEGSLAGAGRHQNPLPVGELQARLAAMAALQAAHNRRVHPQWERQGHAYYRAVWVECAELLEHYGWKWWKRQAPDLEQVKLEVVDIWHFGLSELIRAGVAPPALAARFHAALRAPPPADFRLAVEALAAASLRTAAFDLEAFVAVTRALPLGFDELFEMYVAKNVLNTFRQQHGYREGRYRKRWQGREDNEHLAELIRTMDAAAADFPQALAGALAARYAASGQAAGSGGAPAD